MASIISVSQLNHYVSFQLKEDPDLKKISVRGEISNFTNHRRSGHLYFTLHDEECSVKAVMFAHNTRQLKFTPRDGMRVVAFASVSLYEKEGSYQLYVTNLLPDGTGARAQELEQLREKLTYMGVFNESRKRSLPALPQKIGVVTSDSGAALQDIRNILSRRYPIGTLCVYPALVQGKDAPDSIQRAIFAAQRDECDVLIVGRGGGSSEDLAAFQTEQVVLAISRCEIPVISAVGHETDWTLSDDAADFRAPTPSAAAELVAPDREQLMHQIRQYQERLSYGMQQILQRNETELQQLSDVVSRNTPIYRLESETQSLTILQDSLNRDMTQYFSKCDDALYSLTEKLEMLSPLRNLSRGYAIVDVNGKICRSARKVAIEDTIRIRLYDGELIARVMEKTGKEIGENHEV